VTASQIVSYGIQINEVIPSNGIHNVDYTTNILSMKVNHTTTELNFELNSDKPHLYCLTLEVKDVADNVRRCRRFLLVDDTTFIETHPDRNLLFTSASPDTGFKWQIHHNSICLSWKEYFLNKFYFDNELLNGFEADPYGLITGTYEQTSGELPVSGTQNVYGIVEYFVSWKLNDGPFTPEVEVPDFLNQTLCQQLPVEDGDTYTFIVRPVDIVGSTYKDSRTVFIDTSPPFVDDLCIHNATTKEHCESLISDTDPLFLTFAGYDNHSGILQMEWVFGMHSATNDSEAVEFSHGEFKLVNIHTFLWSGAAAVKSRPVLHHCVVIFSGPQGLWSVHACCLNLKMEFRSCARGRQWCGIIHYYL